MTAPAVRVQGLSRLVRTMKAAEVEVDELKAVTIKATAIAAAAITREAPVGTTGKLRASVRGSKTARRGRVSAGRASVPYAGPIHWGWQGVDVTGRRHNLPGDPFGERGLEAAEPAILDVYRRGIEEILGKVKGA